MNDLGVLIGVSQLPDAAFDQVLALSCAPVIASHSDVRALVDNGRTLTDAQLDALKANGGAIAVNALSASVRPFASDADGGGLASAGIWSAAGRDVPFARVSG